MSGGGEGNGRGIGLPRNDRMSGNGLNPNRQKGFRAAASRRIETPTLNDMRARQGAVVAKFMNLICMTRRSTPKG